MSDAGDIKRGQKGVLSIDGDYYPVDFESYSAQHDLILRTDLGVSVNTVMMAVELGVTGPVETVAVAMLSLLQEDQPADARWLQRHIRSDSDVSIVSGFEPIPA